MNDAVNARTSERKERRGFASMTPEKQREIASKGGRGKRGRMDVGIVYRDGLPLYIITAFTDNVPQVMDDGTPGYTISIETLGKLSQICWSDFR